MFLKALAAGMVLLSVAVPAYAQSLIDVQVAGDTFAEGDAIVISGKTTTVIEGTQVALQILLGEGNIVYAAQITPAEDGSFTETIIAKGPYWKTDGERIVRVIYGAGDISETTFNFVAKHETVRIENIFEVQLPGSTSTTDIKYSIIGGTVEDMIIDRSRFSLIVVLDAVSSGAMTMELPRGTVDARTGGCEGGDDVFIVLIDEREAPYQDIHVSAVDRIIEIEFEGGDSDVEIIGTCVIPEFGGVAVAVLAISIVSIILVSRRSAGLAMRPSP